MRNFSNLILLCFGLFLSLFISNCQDGGSELPNEIRGQLVASNNRPAANVKVGLYSVNYIPADSNNRGLAFSTKTNASGSYVFHDIPTGQYNILGLQDSLGFFRDSITVTGGASIGKDSLRLLGMLSGRVQLQAQDEPQNAMIQVTGTNTYLNVDSDGFFTLSGLAEGTYRLRVFVALPNYVSLFAEVQVRSGRHDTLAKPLRPFFSGIPVVENIQTSLDTLRGIAKITWHPVSYPGLLSYVVYRDPANSIALSGMPVNKYRIVDTVFYDTLYSDPSDYYARSWEYRVCVQAKNTRIGEPFKPQILEAVPPSIFNTDISFERIGENSSYIFKGDTLHLIAYYLNAVYPNQSLVWINGKNDTLRKVGLTNKFGGDTLKWQVSQESKNDSISVKVMDAKGLYWKKSFPFSVRASRMIGNLNTRSFSVDAYPHEGKIVHVSTDSVGKVFVGLFDTKTKTDSTLTSPKSKNGDLFDIKTALYESNLYLFGTRFSDFPGSNVMIYNLATGSWMPGPSLKTPFIPRAAVASMGKVYMIYSDSSEMVINRMAVFDIASKVWSFKEPLSYYGYEARLHEINNKMYFLGSGGDAWSQATILQYDPIGEKWLPVPPSDRIGEKRGSYLVGLKGSLYHIGGHDPISDTAFNRVEVFDASTQEWLACPPLLIRRNNAGVVALGNRIFVLGGNGWENQPWGGAGPSLVSSVEEYLP